MNALARKYTENSYVTEEELKQLFLPVQFDMVWREIRSYRELLRIDLPGQRYLTDTRKLQSMQRKTDILVNHMIRKGIIGNEKYTGCDPKREAVLERIYQFQMHCPLKELCHQLWMQPTELTEYLDVMEPNWLIQLFVIITMAKGSERQLLLLWLGHEMCAVNLVMKLAELPCEQSGSSDQTPMYASWLMGIFEYLQALWHQRQKEMDKAYLRELRLMERYPQLKDYQAEFFETHRTPGHYYTIEQFLQTCHTCYETARMSMEEFVRLGWYQKKKCGKKHVYFVAE